MAALVSKLNPRSAEFKARTRPSPRSPPVTSTRPSGSSVAGVCWLSVSV